MWVAQSHAGLSSDHCSSLCRSIPLYSALHCSFLFNVHVKKWFNCRQCSTGAKVPYGHCPDNSDQSQWCWSVLGRNCLRSEVSVHLFNKSQTWSPFSAICCCPSVCLSVVCNVRVPYSGCSNFRQYFYGIRYVGHLLTSTKNFTEIIPAEPSAGGAKQERGSQV